MVLLTELNIFGETLFELHPSCWHNIFIMNSRGRILKSLNHEEPDRVPYDLASTQVTGISAGAYRKLSDYLGMRDELPEWLDVVQQVVIPSEAVFDRLQVDTRGLFPLTSHNWDVYSKLEDAGENWSYRDEWGMVHHFPKKEGKWFTIVENPMQKADFTSVTIQSHPWPDASDRRRIEALRKRALRFREKGKLVVMKGLCAGLCEMAQRIRGMENAMLDPLLYPAESDLLIGKITDLKIEFWQMALRELHDVVDVVAEADDYGTQESQLISPEQFRMYYKPHLKRLIAEIKNAAPQAFIFFHSCGSVRPIIPDFIEMGIDILNPVHVTARGMEPSQLKEDFGMDITFWGGGIETQEMLPFGTPGQIQDHVKRNIDALAPGGGFIFNTIHNIQSEVPPESIMAMWETLQEYGEY